MQSACSGGTGTFIEKTARKLQVPSERLADMPYANMSLHKISSKCGIFAETDANTLVKTGRAGRGDHRQPVRGGRLPEPGHADQGQHADCRRCCCWAAPTCSSRGCRRRGATTSASCGRSGRSSCRPAAIPPRSSSCPTEALYYACLGCVEIGQGEKPEVGCLPGTRQARVVGRPRASTRRRPRRAPRGLITGQGDLATFVSEYVRPAPSCPAREAARGLGAGRAATSAAPPPRPSCCPRTASCSFPATRCPRATRSRTPSRCSGRSTRPASPTSAGSR